ncbi:MAG: DUF6527 family protein [Pseudomonas sp.]
MSAFTRLSPILEQADGMLFFECPGCNMLHGVNIETDVRPRWGWNGSIDKPTFTPSVLVRYDWGPERKPMVCHSFVTDGRIQFLADCTHALAGQTVDLPKLDVE